MAAFAGPLVLGALWCGVTLKEAYSGLLSGFTVFNIIHSQVLEPKCFIGVGLEGVVTWLRAEGPYPYFCAVMGEIVSIIVTFVVSKLTQPLPEAHLQALFSEAQQNTGGAS